MAVDEVLEKIRVILEAQTDQYERNLNRASSVTDREIGRIENRMRMLAERIVAAFAVEKIARFVEAQFEAVAGLKDLADQIGVTTDQLQVYQFAAVQSGVSADQMQQAVMRLSRSMGEAQTGQKSYIDAFNLMGVRILDAQGKLKSTDTVLRLIADAYQKSGDKTKFLAGLTAVMGREAQRLIPLLQDGSRGFDEFGNAARAAGDVIDAKLIASAKEADDHINAMWTSVKKLTQTLVAEASPALKQFADYLNTVVTTPLPTPSWTDTMLQDIRDRITTYEALNAVTGLYTEKLGQLKSAELALQATSDWEKTHANMVAGRTTGKLYPPSKPVDNSGGTNPPIDTGSTRGLQKNRFDELMKTYDQEIRLLHETDRNKEIDAAITKAQAAAYEDFNNFKRKTIDLTDDEKEKVADMTGELFDQKEVMRKNAAAALAWNDAIVKFGEEADQRMQEVKRDLEDQRQTIVGMTTDVTNVALGFESWKDAARQAITVIIGELSRMKALGGEGGGLFGDNGIFGKIFNMVFSVGSAAAGGIGGAPGGIGRTGPLGFATGGMVQAGMPITVGESGPERFIPSVPGRIAPHGIGEGGGPAGIVIENIHLNGATEKAVVRLEMMMRDMQIKQRRASQGAVMDRARRSAGGVDSLIDF